VILNLKKHRKKVIFKGSVYILKKVLKKVLKKGITTVDKFLRKK